MTARQRKIKFPAKLIQNSGQKENLYIQTLLDNESVNLMRDGATTAISHWPQVFVGFEVSHGTGCQGEEGADSELWENENKVPGTPIV